VRSNFLNAAVLAAQKVGFLRSSYRSPKPRPYRAFVADELGHREGKHLVIVRYTKLHDPTDEWVTNDADIDNAKVVWARELDARQNARLSAYFKDRHIWLVTPDANSRNLQTYSPPNSIVAPLE
jgi:hypothetical protein